MNINNCLDLFLMKNKENNKQDPLKITIRFLTNEIRADGIEIIVHKKLELIILP